MHKARFQHIISVVILLSFLFVRPARASDDGFGQAGKEAGRYFDIYYAPSLETPELSRQLDIRAADRILSGGPVEKSASFVAGLAGMIDTLFLQICDILDMHVYSFKGNIKICRDQAHLERVYRALFNQGLNDMRSFYVESLNTIYISAESFQSGILGHEIAHAIMSRYFVVPPPVKAAEVLAGYVEYQLRKTSR
ncbi:MAG TPA: hypothetical protein DCL35_08260 [Candidatus Omnitrophica bacterium]|nr:hypothetical protein [Candidatus Omnitrophota bacterium]